MILSDNSSWIGEISTEQSNRAMASALLFYVNNMVVEREKPL